MLWSWKKQRCRDGVMSDFVSWCRHLLVPSFFMKWHPYIPPSFHRNDFSTCSTHFFFGAKPQQKCVARARIYTLRTRMRTRTTPPIRAMVQWPLRTCTRTLWRRSSVCPWRAPRSTVGIYGERKTIAWCPCTPPSTVERFGEKISAEACSGKEIAGLLKMMMMMMMMKNMMTRKSRNCIWADSRVANRRQVGTS